MIKVFELMAFLTPNPLKGAEIFFNNYRIPSPLGEIPLQRERGI
jgi:hypothetical protein